MTSVGPHGRGFASNGPRPFKAPRTAADGNCMAQIILLAFFLLVGPLAVLFGADSRLDDRRGSWPAGRS